jgi:hypothetical protein
MILEWTDKMKRIFLSFASFVMMASSVLGVCDPKKQHCYQTDLRHPIIPIPDKYFDSRVDCGLNAKEVENCQDAFCRAVKQYSETKDRLLKALNEKEKDMPKIEGIVKSLAAIKKPLMSTGLTAEQVFNIPVPANFTCNPLRTAEQKKDMLTQVGQGNVKKNLYKGQYPRQDVFSDKNSKEFDLCKIDHIVRAERGGLPQISNGMAQGLKLYANNKQTMANYANIPDEALRKAMNVGLKKQQVDYIRDFAEIGITQEQLETLPLTADFEDQVKRNCH